MDTMTQVKVPLTVKWNMDVQAKDLREYLLKSEALRPYELVIGAKHAEYLEFGTGPAQHREGEMPIRQPWMTDQQYYEEVYNCSEFYRSIFDWTRRKAYPNESRKEQYRIAYRIYGEICKNGLWARPFWRPSFYYMCEHMDEWFRNGMDTKDIIEMMYKKVKEMMDYNINARIGSEYMRYNGTMEESMVINALSEEEARQAKDAPMMQKPTIRGISDDTWEQKSKQQGKDVL